MTHGQRLLGTIGLMLLGVGCTSYLVPIPNLDNQPVSRALTRAEVGNAIQDGAAAAGWESREAAPGRILAWYRIRTHTVRVEITYDERGYNIAYESSQNMKVGCPGPNKIMVVTGEKDCPGGQKPDRIHENYKAWIAQLSQAIASELR